MLARKLFMQVRFASSNTTVKKSGLSRGWHNAFGKYLLFTNTWTSGVLMMAGDLIEQELEFQKDMLPARYDWTRVGCMFITGLGLGPLHHYFYGWMDKALPKRSISSVTQKILLDQVVMSPACIVMLFYTMGTLEGNSLKESTKELKEKFLEVYTMDWCIWPPTQFLNFYLVPVKYQVLYINAITMLYNVYLSYVKHRNTASEYTVLSEVTCPQDDLQNLNCERCRLCQKCNVRSEGMQPLTQDT